MISLPGGVVGTVELAEVSDVCFRAVAAAAAAAPSGAAKKRRLSHSDAKNLGAGGNSTAGAGAGAGREGEEALDLRALLKPMQPVRCYVLGLVGGDNSNGQQPKQGSLTSSSSSSKQGSARTPKNNSPHLALSLRASNLNKNLAFKHLMPGFPLAGALVPLSVLRVWCS
jgi:hypothetical protein